MHAAIVSIGTANPPYKRAQLDVADLIADGFHLNPVQKKVLKRIYNSSGIEQRHSVLSDYCKKPGEFDFFPNDPCANFPSTAQRMVVYKANALDLALAAIDDCLKNTIQNITRNDPPRRPEYCEGSPAFGSMFASGDPSSQAPRDDGRAVTITHVITVSCTGMYAPGIDIEIVQRLNLSSSTQRTSINFMGCYGAFNGMKVANAICQAEPEATVLLVCVELCSIHIQKDFTLDNIISNALFADGAAAVLIKAQPDSGQQYLRFKSFHCDIMPQTSQEMAWHIGDSGFDMVLTAYVPEAIKSGIAAFFDKLINQSNQSIADIDYYAIHPGGMKILQACEESLGITPHDNRFSYDVLRQYGNMSSATVLFVLKKIWDELSETKHNKTLFSCAFGPGLTLESMVLGVQGKSMCA